MIFSVSVRPATRGAKQWLAVVFGALAGAGFGALMVAVRHGLTRGVDPFAGAVVDPASPRSCRAARDPASRRRRRTPATSGPSCSSGSSSRARADPLHRRDPRLGPSRVAILIGTAPLISVAIALALLGRAVPAAAVVGHRARGRGRRALARERRARSTSARSASSSRFSAPPVRDPRQRRPLGAATPPAGARRRRVALARVRSSSSLVADPAPASLAHTAGARAGLRARGVILGLAYSACSWRSTAAACRSSRR
jgi:hypothetical protein